MKRLCLSLASLALAAFAGGCPSPSHPLDGVWTDTESTSGLSTTVTLDLNADGTMVWSQTVAANVDDTCTGSLEFTGLTWTSTSTAITVAGNPQCSGSIQCSMSGTQTCDPSSGGSPIGSFDYTLSNNNDTLVLQLGGESLTFTRQR
jgi:hypothetical protein